jgi:DnaK suppressor protein
LRARSASEAVAGASGSPARAGTPFASSVPIDRRPVCANLLFLYGVSTVTPKELDQYRDWLLALRDRLSGDVSNLAGEALRQTGGEAAGNLSNTPLHLADLGSDTFAEDINLGLLENERLTYKEVGDALERITKGTYGYCERCHQEIARERLRALPYVRYCVRCAQELEAEGLAKYSGST